MDENPYEASGIYEPRRSHWHRFVLVPYFSALGAVPGCVWLMRSFRYGWTFPFTENPLNAWAMLGVGTMLGGLIGLIGGLLDFIRDSFSPHR